MSDRSWAWAASGWCLIFGLLSLAWAANARILVNQLSPSIREQADERESGFVAILVITGLAKILGGFVPVLWVSGRLPRWNRWLGPLTLSGGVLLTLYGLGDVISGFLGVTGIRDLETDAEQDAALWYLVLWGPVWLLGGITFLGTWLTHKRNRPG